MPETDIQPQAPSATRRRGTTDTPAEARPFDQGGVDLSGDAPAELLMGEASSGANTAARPAGDGTAAFSETSGAAQGASPLKDAAGELVVAVRNVLQGKAGSARVMAKDAYEQLRGRTATTRTRADAFVRERPYAALGAAVVAGMLLSRLMRRR